MAPLGKQLNMDPAQIGTYIKAGAQAAIPTLLQGNLFAIYSKASKCREAAGVSVEALEELIMSANPSPTMLDLDAEFAMAPQVQEKLGCDFDTAQGYAAYFIINQIAVAYIASRLERVGKENDFSLLRDERDKRKMLSDLFQEWSGLGDGQTTGVLTQFDTDCNDALAKHGIQVGGQSRA